MRGHLATAVRLQITAISLVSMSFKVVGVYASESPMRENSERHKNDIRFKLLQKMTRRLTKLEKNK